MRMIFMGKRLTIAEKIATSKSETEIHYKRIQAEIAS